MSEIPTDTELLILMGGSNDWAQGKDMGTIDSPHDFTTFYGAYQLWLDKLYVALPNAKIVMMIQPFRADMYANGNGFVLQDYRDATIKIAHKYGYPLVNTLDAGINQLNYTANLSDVVHPNTIGAKKIAEVIVGKLRSIEPIV